MNLSLGFLSFLKADELFRDWLFTRSAFQNTEIDENMKTYEYKISLDGQI